MENNLFSLSAEIYSASMIIFGLSNQLDDNKTDTLTVESFQNALQGVGMYLQRISDDLSDIHDIQVKEEYSRISTDEIMADQRQDESTSGATDNLSKTAAMGKQAMNKMQNEMLERIFLNFNDINDDYDDLPETVQAGKELSGYMLKKYSKKDVIDLEGRISNVTLEYEKQGFIYGFKYAVALLMGGQANEKSNGEK